MNIFTIEKNVPMPRMLGALSKKDFERFIDNEMTIGDSILINNPSDLTKLYAAARNMRLKNGYKEAVANGFNGGTYHSASYPKIKSKSVQTDAVNNSWSVRVWRTA